MSSYRRAWRNRPVACIATAAFSLAMIIAMFRGERIESLILAVLSTLWADIAERNAT